MPIVTDITDRWLEAARCTLDNVWRGFAKDFEDPSPVTKYRVIYEGGKLSLRHYEAAGRSHATPILIVYSLIKRPFILDLQPGSSVIENLTRQGFDVYLTDWIPPSRTDSWRGFDAYVNQLANAVRAVQVGQGVERVSILGYCLGGLLASLYAALHPQNVKNLVTLATPIDMDASALPAYSLIRWLDRQAVDSLTAVYDNCPAWLLGSFFSTMAPMQRLLSSYLGLNQYSERDCYSSAFPGFRRWLDSDVAIAGRLFRELVWDLFKKNSLVKGGFRLGGESVKLNQIVSPLLNVIAALDVVVNPRSSLPLVDLVGSSDKKTFIFPTGHIGVALSEEAHTSLWPRIGKWLEQRDE